MTPVRTARTDAPVQGRGGEAPLRAECEVLARRREGAYWTLSLSAPQIAERARPGQFVNIAVRAPQTLLRRPFSIAGVSRQGPAAGTVSVVFDANGPGTEWLTEVEAHDLLDVVGPLGTAFPLPQQKVTCLLIGGGYGLAPLFFLAEALTRQGLRVDMIVGASTQERIYNAIEAKRMTASVTFTTDDGSYGVHGRVTDVMERVADSCRTGVVYACGPMPMLRAVSERARDLELPCQVAVEEQMGCGTGVCWTCVVPIRARASDDGEPAPVRMRRSCVEGPVFNAARIAWDLSRWEVGPPLLVDDDVDQDVPARPSDADLWG